jgi:hypothetical protein
MRTGVDDEMACGNSRGVRLSETTAFVGGERNGRDLERLVFRSPRSPAPEKSPPGGTLAAVSRDQIQGESNSPKGNPVSTLVSGFNRWAATDGILFLCVAALWCTFMMLLRTNGINGFSPDSYRTNLLLYGTALGAAIIIAVIAVLLRHRPDRPIAFLYVSFCRTGLADRLVQGAPMLLALVVFLPIFGVMKAAIPVFSSYTWDTTWIELDRALHGTEPWRILQPIVGHPLITSMLSVLYHAWIALIYLGVVYFCFFQSDREIRLRFFISYFGCWVVLGIVLATVLASVGPCFMAPILGDHRFDEQMAYLRAANEIYPVLVLHVQEGLVASFQSSSGGLGRGISAMPSMHVSIAFLFFLAMRKISKPMGVFFGIFFVLTVISSIHLGYHYAVDGYVAIIGTGLIWLLSGKVARRLTQGNFEETLPRRWGSPPR